VRNTWLRELLDVMRLLFRHDRGLSPSSDDWQLEGALWQVPPLRFRVASAASGGGRNAETEGKSGSLRRRLAFNHRSTGTSPDGGGAEQIWD
jgi:hypothetical protein